MLTFATHFALILANLRKAVAIFADHQARPIQLVWLGDRAYAPLPDPTGPAPLPTAIWHLLVARLGHLSNRLQSLFARFQAGTLRPPAPSHPPAPSRPRTPTATQRPYTRLPTRHLWVVAHVRDAAPCATQIEALFATPEFPAVLAAAPQAARLLRPLCAMLGANLPPALALPPRPPRQRPQRPPRPAPLPDPPLPAYIRAAVRAWRPKFG